MPQPSAAEALTPPPELVARFRRDLERLTGTAPAPGQMLGLGISGGSDSVALLLLAAAAYPGAVRAATVVHGLRPEAADEAALVAGLCGRLGVPHAILPPPPGHLFVGNVQERARMLRYAALRFWAQPEEGPAAAQWVAVAHQRDDVAETFLMRARRGSGVRGLAAMRRSRRLEEGEPSGPLLVRPLLDWSRADLAGLVACLGVGTVADPSNVDPRYDRSRIRALIATSPELVPSRLALAAQNLRHAEDAIEWAVARELGRFGTNWDADHWFDPRGLPYEIRRRMTYRAIGRVRFDRGIVEHWHSQGLDRLVATLDAGGTGTLAGVKASARPGEWRFTPAPARRSH